MVLKFLLNETWEYYKIEIYELLIHKQKYNISWYQSRFQPDLFTVFHMITQQTITGLQDVHKTSSRYFLKTSWNRLQRNNFLSSKTSWRPAKCVLGRNLYLYLTNLNLHLTNLYLTNLYLTNLALIQDNFKAH